MDAPSCLINAASAALQLTISRNARQSLPDNDNTPEEVVTAFYTRNMSMGGGGMYAFAGWHEQNGSIGTSCGSRRPRKHVPQRAKDLGLRSLIAASHVYSVLRLPWSRTLSLLGEDRQLNLVITFSVRTLPKEYTLVKVNNPPAAGRQ